MKADDLADEIEQMFVSGKDEHLLRRAAEEWPSLESGFDPSHAEVARLTRVVAKSRLTLYLPLPLTYNISSPPIIAIFFIKCNATPRRASCA